MSIIILLTSAFGWPQGKSSFSTKQGVAPTSTSALKESFKSARLAIRAIEPSDHPTPIAFVLPKGLSRSFISFTAGRRDGSSHVIVPPWPGRSTMAARSSKPLATSFQTQLSVAQPWTKSSGSLAINNPPEGGQGLFKVLAGMLGSDSHPQSRSPIRDRRGSYALCKDPVFEEPSGGIHDLMVVAYLHRDNGRLASHRIEPGLLEPLSNS